MTNGAGSRSKARGWAPKGPWRSRRHRDARHHPALVPQARRPEVRRLEEAWPRPSADDKRPCRTRTPYGEGESSLGAMKSLGHEIGRSTVERILRDSGIEPAPQRGERTS